MTTLKGLPLAYNKDLQEDKEGVFDTVKTIIPSLKIFTGMIKTLKVNKERMAASTKNDFSNATELADYLAVKEMPFRQAHGVVGKLVLRGIKEQKNLQDMDLSELKEASDLISEDVYSQLTSKAAVERRNSPGGTGFKQVEKKLQAAKTQLKADQKE